MSATHRQCARRPPGMRCPVGQDHVTLALACLAVGLRVMVADERLGVGLRLPPASPTLARGRVPQRRVDR